MPKRKHNDSGSGSGNDSVSDSGSGNGSTQPPFRGAMPPKVSDKQRLDDAVTRYRELVESFPELRGNTVLNDMVKYNNVPTDNYQMLIRYIKKRFPKDNQADLKRELLKLVPSKRYCGKVILRHYRGGHADECSTCLTHQRRRKEDRRIRREQKMSNIDDLKVKCNRCGVEQTIGHMKNEHKNVCSNPKPAKRQKLLLE